MTVRLSVAIQTHPRRAEMAADLAVRLPGAELAVDPDPDNRVKSPWRTYRHALETTPGDATHRLVIQDDAHPCRNFQEAARRIASARPDRLVVLFLAGQPRNAVQALLRACRDDQAYALLPPGEWVPAVAVLWPVELIRPTLDYVDSQRWPPEFKADDEIIRRAMEHLGHRPLITVPSLVEHPDLVWSITGKYRPPRGGEDPMRVAACFIGDDDPLLIDWT